MGLTSSGRSKSDASLIVEQKAKFNDKTVTQLISEGKLAPLEIKEMRNNESIIGVDVSECPICFLTYKSLNDSSCCNEKICTNCYIALRNDSCAAFSNRCPFCHQVGFLTKYNKKSKFDYMNDENMDYVHKSKDYQSRAHIVEVSQVSIELDEKSYSNGDNSNDNKSKSIVATTNDRVKLENTIKSQRCENEIVQVVRGNNETEHGNYDIDEVSLAVALSLSMMSTDES